MTRRLKGVCTAAMLLLAGRSAAAGGAHQIVVFPVVPISGEVQLGPARDMSAAVFEELKLNPEIDLVIGQDRTEGGAAGQAGGGTADPAEYRQALIEIDEGARHAHKLRFPAAIRSLSSGIDRLHANLELLDSHERLTEAYLQLSVAYFRRGKEKLGTGLLEDVVRLDPSRTLEPERYPPLFLSAFEQARRRVLSLPRGTLRVTSAPEGADVLLNGRPMGRTPLVVDEVISGLNHVVVRSAAGIWAERVEVRGGRMVEVMADLGGAGPRGSGAMQEALSANRFDKEARRAAVRGAAASGGEWAVVLVMGRGRGVYSVGGLLGNVRTGKWATVAPVAPDFDLFSASIEAHTLGRNIVEAIKDFAPNVRADTVPVLAGKRVQTPAAAPQPSDNRARFVGADASSGERPVDPHQLVAPPPQGGRSAQAQGGGQEPALPSAQRLGDVPPPNEDPGGVTIVDGDAIAAVAPIHAEGDPMAPPPAEATRQGPSGWTPRWWFWTAVGVGAVGLGVGAWALLRDPAADEVRVEAVW